MKITEKMRTDLFYLNLENETITWIRHDDKTYLGGQFISMRFGEDLLKEAIAQYESAEEIMEFIAEKAETEITKYGTVDYAMDMYRISRDDPDFCGCTDQTVQMLSQMFTAKELINAYTNREFDSDAEFSNLRKVAIGYTTITDEEYPMQAYVNLLEHRIEVHLDDRLAYFEQYDSLSDMISKALEDLSFDDLYSVPDWIVEKHEREMKIDSLAVRMTFFMKEHDLYSYLDILEPTQNDADMVSMVRRDLHNLDTYPGMIHEMQDMMSNVYLTESETKQCYEIMTELFTIYADERFGPLAMRETEIMIDVLEYFGYKDYEAAFNERGFHAILKGEKWHGEEIYKFIVETQSPERIRQLRDDCFELFTDFVKAAELHGIHIDVKSQASPDRRLSR